MGIRFTVEVQPVSVFGEVSILVHFYYTPVTSRARFVPDQHTMGFDLVDIVAQSRLAGAQAV